MDDSSQGTLEFWFEFGSTYSYPAAMRVERVAASRGVRVAWRPFLLGAVFQAQGLRDSPFNVYEAKGRYMWRDLERICEELDLRFRRPSVFPRNGLLAARVACRFADEPWAPAFVKAVYRANFEQDRDISARETIEDCLASAGRQPAEILAAAGSPEAKEKLRAQTERAMGSGIFGAPSFLVGKELFWGNDRLEAAVAWCAGPGVPAGA